VSFAKRCTEGQPGVKVARLLRHGEHKANLLTDAPMPVRSCKVTIEDLNGVSHTAVPSGARPEFLRFVLGDKARRTQGRLTTAILRDTPLENTIDMVIAHDTFLPVGTFLHNFRVSA